MCKHHTNPIDIRAELTKRYPGLDADTIAVFVNYEIARQNNHGDNIHEAPIVPERIKSRHPFAH